MKKKTILISAFLIVSSFSILVTLTHAGVSSILPATFHGTTINVSISYPDTFEFIRDGTRLYGTTDGISNQPVSLSISATFNNESISVVKINRIAVRLYETSVNLTSMAADYQYPHSSTDCYAYADWYSADDDWAEYLQNSSATEYNLYRTSFGQTSDLSLDLPLAWSSSAYKGGKGKLFIYILFSLLDTNGNTVIFNFVDSMWGDFKVGITQMILYTGSGEAPYVTINAPQEENPSFFPDSPELIIVIGLLIATIVIVVIFLSRRKKKTIQQIEQPNTV
jgi:hypothetical protein